jgi:hypothetical protein
VLEIRCLGVGAQNIAASGKRFRSSRVTLLLLKKEFDSLRGMVESVASNPDCQDIFRHGISELSLFRNFSLGGTTLRKSRIDWLPRANALADVKTCVSANKREFSGTILERGYHTQAAYYLDIVNDSSLTLREPKQCFIFIAVEKTPPYAVCIYNLEQKAIGKARTKNIERLAKYIQCQGCRILASV